MRFSGWLTAATRREVIGLFEHAVIEQGQRLERTAEWTPRAVIAITIGRHGSADCSSPHKDPMSRRRRRILVRDDDRVGTRLDRYGRLPTVRSSRPLTASTASRSA
jgi:hypothetical protein